VKADRSARRSIGRHVLLGVATFVVIAYVAINVAVRFSWTADFVRRELNRAVLIATDSTYGLNFGSLSFSWNFQKVTLRSIELMPLGPDASIDVASITALTIRDVHWIRTILGNPSIDEIVVDAPRLALSLDFITAGADSAPRSSAAPDRESVRGEVGDLRLLGGSVVVTSYTDHGKQTTVLNEVDLEILGLGSGWKEPVGFILANSNVRLKVGSAHLALDDSLHAIDIQAVDVSSQESTVRVGSMGIGPLVSDSEFVSRLEYRKDRISVFMSDVVFHSADFGAAVRDGSIRASLVTVDSFGIDVYSDHRVPGRAATEQRKFLTEQLRDLPNRIAIDSAVVLDGVVRYTEHPSDGMYPGTFTLEGVTGSILNLSNDPEHALASEPLVARAHGMLQGVRPITAEVSIPVHSPTFDMHFTASAESVDAAIFNDMTVPLEGIEFVSGHVDTLWVDGFATNSVAAGVVNMHYRDLAVRTVDKNSGEQNFGRRVVTVIANLLFVDSQNTPEERDFRVGQINHTRKLGDTMWGFLWFSVRSGLLALIVRGGELPM